MEKRVATRSVDEVSTAYEAQQQYSVEQRGDTLGAHGEPLLDRVSMAGYALIGQTTRCCSCG